jgi:hypothetical protein
MDAEDTTTRRVRFYGLNDYGTYFQAERAAEILEHYDPSPVVRTISDILELHNVQQYAENDLFPSSHTEVQRLAYKARVPELRKTVAKFFNAISDADFANVVVEVDYEYHADLLQLLSQYKVYDRCSAAIVLSTLEATHISIGEMLANQKLVRSYDQELRALLVSEPRNAEHVIRKYLEKDLRRPIYLPASLTTSDARRLIESYLDSDDANPNFMELIATGRMVKEVGIDAKLKLKAKRKHNAWMADFFKNNAGIRSGCEVSISDTQTEPVVTSLDGLVAKFSYSRRWLEENLDFPTVLNNFIYLFDFSDRHMLLTLPSYRAELGVLERFMKTASRDGYPTGTAFRVKDQSSLLHTVMYAQFLRTKDIELESILAWFFTDYVTEHFGAMNFRFAPSTKTSSYLERCRHLFSEMESVVKQFSLYAENGELDIDLLTMTSDQVRYKDIPSLLNGKYVYANDNRDIGSILHLLFSDQSGLTYINENLRDDCAARLLIRNRIAYDDFADYQKSGIDSLISLGVLENTGERVQLASTSQLIVLKAIFETETASYYHYSTDVRAVIDDMVNKGWLVRRESLLTESEGSYFNYYLNQAEFSNGPDLRNKYLHGSQADADSDGRHLQTYFTVLKLLIALAIKINDDFWLDSDERRSEVPSNV